MTALGFSEHGNIYGWWRKKCAIEAAGMKYMHACEFYLTESLHEKVRDNYHCVLLSRNYDGFLELNRLVTRAHNRKDNHFYYVPRISFDDLFATSENIFVTTACVGGPLCKGDERVQEQVLRFLEREKHRCFLEVGHHMDPKQVSYNEKLLAFLQIILDASAYAFSWNHSDPYSCTGYICGWLRHYHPLEFLTTALNVFDKLEKQAEIIQYASKIGICVTPPKFGVSQSGYAFDAEKRVIAKGLASMKHMGAAVAGEVYALSQRGDWDHFVDLLRDIFGQTHINSRQIDSLIKVDFFADYGNQRKLLRIVELFEQLKRGEAKQIKREQIDGGPYCETIQNFANCCTKSGGDSKSYTFTDLPGFLRACEKIILQSGLEEFSLAARVRNFAEIMGYNGYVTGVEADRRKLFVKEVRPLHRKSDGKRFGYSVATQSIGSGKEGQFTVRNALFERMPLQSGDVLQCLGWERHGQYFHMTNYTKQGVSHGF
jgi:DNA polymerase III alpha subunit